MAHASQSDRKIAEDKLAKFKAALDGIAALFPISATELADRIKRQQIRLLWTDLLNKFQEAPKESAESILKDMFDTFKPYAQIIKQAVYGSNSQLIPRDGPLYKWLTQMASASKKVSTGTAAKKSGLAGAGIVVDNHGPLPSKSDGQTGPAGAGTGAGASIAHTASTDFLYTIGPSTSRSAETPYLTDRLVSSFTSENSLQYVAIPRDGNCFFRAMLEALEKDGEQHSTLRENAVKEVGKSKYAEFIPSSEKASYVKRMRTEGEYASSAILAATANLLNVNLTVCEIGVADGVIQSVSSLGDSSNERKALLFFSQNADGSGGHYFCVRGDDAQISAAIEKAKLLMEINKLASIRQQAVQQIIETKQQQTQKLQRAINSRSSYSGSLLTATSFDQEMLDAEHKMVALESGQITSKLEELRIQLPLLQPRCIRHTGRGGG